MPPCPSDHLLSSSDHDTLNVLSQDLSGHDKTDDAKCRATSLQLRLCREHVGQVLNILTSLRCYFSIQLWTIGHNTIWIFESDHTTQCLAEIYLNMTRLLTLNAGQPREQVDKR